jgi:DNA-binding transcriptional regulator YdaS (Cro superfamily)
MADVYGRIRTAVRKAGSQRAFAQQVGVSDAFVSGVLNGARPPTDAILRQVGIKRVVNFYEVQAND